MIMLMAMGSAQAEREALTKTKTQYCTYSNPQFHYINPVIAGVKRVVVAVDQAGLSQEFRNEDLPEPLQKENLEKLLQELYENRFSSRKGTLLSTESRGCHDRNDQPVTIIDLKAKAGIISKSGQERFEAATKEKDTLSILLKVGLIESDSRYMDTDSHTVVFYMDQLRPGVPEYNKTQHGFPYSMSVSVDEETIGKTLKYFIRSQIN